MSEVEEYQQVAQKLDNLIEVRQKLQIQYNENNQVKEEFSKLTPNNTVYKIIGPALVEQSQQESKLNVDKRIEFIQSEIDRTENEISTTQQKMQTLQQTISKLQQAQVEAAEKAQPAAAA
ncbi:hypothetical protein E3Q22_00653 [Wallemia mellicola]|uniref:Prefoldin beta-like protein n=2 Tax=Wallemia mellicola TaxID=1708541 RepID=A0A4T0LWW5_9BASI|nr:prefoldin subunit 6 [Wallemia mellicola CBS 633.66]TIB71000.1 hypothetical protein E3Q24_02594 [Wallemia mellicola]EIM23078.1 prefoldin subunit 6 [Wallemia mellicola CBS 633.66]TIB74386.1 hypothetical protein E3Q23_02681 [Wallemia mellicola]TIB81842.1 hypothetical protein E3Q22_00653 [Wallemia mellicola]TIB85379.1 hypothetical protein E3Q21_01993 [Wallemia mellicola]|eukprot:XP_006957111.1 prefoldin subunit 6 [Wallemia mellicola CBS 633.66]